MNEPPPLRTHHFQAPGPPKQPDGGRSKALAGLLAPLLAGALAATMKGAQPGTSGYLPIALAGAFMILVGLICSIVGLATSRGRVSTILLGVAGFLLNGVFIAAAVTGFLHARQRALENRKFQESTDQIVREANDNMRKSFDPKKGIQGVDHDAADKILERFQQAGKQLGDQDRRAASAASAMLQLMQAKSRVYEKASQEWSAGGGSRMNITDPGIIPIRQAKTQQFLEANAALIDLLVNYETYLGREMDKAGVDERTKADTTAGTRKSRARLNLLLEIRVSDKTLGEATLAMLRLLGDNPKKWHYDQEKKQIIFQDTKDLENFNAEVAKVKAAAATQIEAQKKLVNLPVI